MGGKSRPICRLCDASPTLPVPSFRMKNSTAPAGAVSSSGSKRAASPNTVISMAPAGASSTISVAPVTLAVLANGSLAGGAGADPAALGAADEAAGAVEHPAINAHTATTANIDVERRRCSVGLCTDEIIESASVSFAVSEPLNVGSADVRTVPASPPQRVRENPTLWDSWTVKSHVGIPRTRWACGTDIVRAMETHVLRSYLIEAYVPKLDQAIALAITATLEGAADRLTELGVRVEWRVAFAIYAEETYFAVVAAPNEDLARGLSEVADLRVDHLIEVTHITRAGRL